MSPFTPGEKLYGGSWNTKELNEFTDICQARQRESRSPASLIQPSDRAHKHPRGSLTCQNSPHDSRIHNQKERSQEVAEVRFFASSRPKAEVLNQCFLHAYKFSR